jgi:hypothetical protein
MARTMAHAAATSHDCRMTDFGSWLRPTMLGPFVTIFGLVTISHFALGGAADDVIFAGHRFDSWLMSMLIAGFLGAAIVVSLIFADVALLSAKFRKLPTGLGAWMSSLLAPFALFVAWHVIGQDGGASVLESVLRFVVPFPASALFVRFALGKSP